MRERIARELNKHWYKGDYPEVWYEMAGYVLTLITEEIEKGLLTDEELGEIIRINHDDRPFKSESAIARGTRQAQLDKILSLLKE